MKLAGLAVLLAATTVEPVAWNRVAAMRALLAFALAGCTTFDAGRTIQLVADSTDPPDSRSGGAPRPASDDVDLVIDDTGELACTCP